MTLVAERIDKQLTEIRYNIFDWFHRRSLIISNKRVEIQDKIHSFNIYSKVVSMTPMK